MEGQQGVRKIVGRERIQALSRRSDLPGLVFFAGHLLTLLATGSVIWLCRGSPWVVAAMVLHGIVIVHLFAPFHESAHGTAFRTRWLNVALVWFSGLALMLPPLHFRFEHAAHHSYTQHPGRDPQMIPMAERFGGYLLYATAIPYFAGLFSSLFRHPFGLFTAEERGFIPAGSLPKVAREAWIMWAVYLLLLALSLVLQTWAVLLFWLLPRILGEPVMRLIRMSEHVGRPHVADLLRNTRTVLTWAPIRWLNWNNAFHAEHHAIPSVPFFALPALHAVLGEHLEEVRPGYVDTQLHLIRHGLGAAST